MRRFLILCSLLPFLGGCQDALGPGGNCSREMDEVRRQEQGSPNASRTQQGGNYVEIWRYPHIAYTFRWGTQYSGCVVETASLDLVPTLLP